MAPPQTSRYSVWKEIALRPASVLASIPWFLMGAFNLLKSEFMPAKLHEKWQLRNLNPWPWWAWALVSLGILMAVILENVYKATRKREQDKHTLQGQLDGKDQEIVRERAEKLRTSTRLIELEQDLRKATRALQDAKEKLAEPPKIAVEIKDMFQRPAPSHFFWNKDVFVLADIDLQNPKELTVKYRLDVNFSGRTIEAEIVDDIGEWSRKVQTEISNDLGFALNPSIRYYRIDALPTELVNGRKVSGWLHFHLSGVPDPEFKDCRLLLRASTPNGGGQDETEVSRWPIFDRDYSIVKRPAEAVEDVVQQ